MEPEFYAEYYAVEDWHWWFSARRKILVDALAARLPPPPAGRRREILDIGCGTGGNLSALSRFGEIQGVDASEEAAHFCRQRGIENVVVHPPGPLPFPAGRFDLVTALDVVEHAQDDLEIIAEARRVLRPNGTLLVTVPAYQFLWGRHDAFAHHFRRYRAGEVRRLLEGRGLRVTHLTYFNTLLFPPVAGVRIARRLLGATEQPGSDLSMSRPGRVNDALRWIFASESLLVRRHRLPFGVSILAMAERP